MGKLRYNMVYNFEHTNFVSRYVQIIHKKFFKEEENEHEEIYSIITRSINGFRMRSLFW